MKAAYIEKPGPPENITFGSLPKPKPVAAQVLVKVKAVAVNPVDTYIRAGIVSPWICPSRSSSAATWRAWSKRCGPDASNYKPRRSRVGQQPRPARPARHIRRIRRHR